MFNKSKGRELQRQTLEAGFLDPARDAGLEGFLEAGLAEAFDDGLADAFDDGLSAALEVGLAAALEDGLACETASGILTFTARQRNIPSWQEALRLRLRLHLRLHLRLRLRVHRWALQAPCVSCLWKTSVFLPCLPVFLLSPSRLFLLEV